MMSSFTIKTAKPWTVVSGFDEQGGIIKDTGSGPVRSRSSPMNARRSSSQSRSNLAPPEVNPYTLGARRASANGDKTWIESYGLIPNHHFKTQKIIQYGPAGEKRRSGGGGSPDNILPPPPLLRGDEIEQPPIRKSFTFHCLQFDNGVLRPASGGAHDGPFTRATFVPSEYQRRVPCRRSIPMPVVPPMMGMMVSPPLPQQPSPPTATVVVPPVEASLEAAHILLDLTRIM